MVPKKSLIPFFSIITCTKDSQEYLPKCLQSVDEQTFRDFEHIIVDGNSKDNTQAILKKFGRTHITTFPRGIGNAMNVGIKQAKGRYLYFLNSDDSFYTPKVLEKMAKYLKNNEDLDWVYGRIHEIREDGSTVGFPPRLPIFHIANKTLLKFYNYIPHQAVFMQKLVFDQFGGFNESLKSMMDDEYWLRVSSKTKWHFTNQIIANYSIRPTSQSESIHNREANTREWESVQKKYLSNIEYFLAKIVNRLLR